jgi:tetratricopeptide (TPR) repeat protein
MQNRKRIFAFVVIVACTVIAGFSILAAEEKAVPAASASRQSSSEPGEKSEETVSREFLAMADVSEFRGVIDEPDGYVNLLKEKRAGAPVITKVKAGEPFQFKKKEGEDWCQVKLKSGVSGWLDCSRIKLYFTRDDLPPKSEKGVEIDEEAREQGINYYDVTQAAARGDQNALKTFFNIHVDGGAAEEHDGVTCIVIHLIGDDAYAKFLREESRDFVSAEGTDTVFPIDDKKSIRQHYPKSAKFHFPYYDQLISDFTGDINCNPKDSDAYRRLGNEEYEKGDCDRAMTDLNRAIELDPKNHVAYWNRAWVDAEKEEYDAAIKDMQKAIQLQPHERIYQFDMERIKGLRTNRSEQ